VVIRRRGFGSRPRRGARSSFATIAESQSVYSLLRLHFKLETDLRQRQGCDDRCDRSRPPRITVTWLK